MLLDIKKYSFKFMTKQEHDSMNSFDHTQRNRIVLNFASKFDQFWVGYYGSSRNKSSEKSYSGIIAYSPFLILDNVDTNAQEVTFLINGHINVDYLVSIYFSINLLENGRLPIYYRDFLDYIECIEDDKLIIDKFNKINLFTMVKANSYSYDYLNIDNTKLISEKIVLRGLEIIDYVHYRLSVMNKYIKSDIFDKSLFELNCDFERERNLIISDYNDYIKNTQNGIVEKARIKVFNKEGSIVFVDALIYKVEQESIFGKYWSRSDLNSPSGSGYDCVLSIEGLFNGKKTIEREQIEASLVEKDIRLSRFCISVNPSKDLNLLGLGMYLELYEQLKEEKIFDFDGSLVNLWRDRSDNEKKRFKDSKWCVNSFPWYDGRLHDYKYVDSPTLDSLLSIEEVKYILENFTEEYLEKVNLKYIYTFNYNYGETEKIEKHLSDRLNIEKEFLDKGSSYFLEKFKIYFDVDKSNSVKYYNLNNLDYSPIKELIKDSINMNQRTHSVDVSHIENIIDIKGRVYLLSYGVGFLELELSSKKQLEFAELFIGNVESINKILYSPNNTFIESFMKCNNEIFMSSNISVINCNTFHWIKPYNELLSEYTKLGIVRRLGSEYSDNNTYSDNVNVLERMSFSLGLTRKGTVGIFKSDYSTTDIYNLNCSDELECTIYKRFYPIYIFVLHQRQALIRFSEMLYHYDKEGRKKEISSLRFSLLKFVTQSWFSHITDDGFGMKLYLNWTDIMETEKLLTEIESQTTTLDEYNKNSLTSLIEIVSIIGLPLVALSTAFGMNILETKGIYIRLEYVFIIMAVILSTAIVILKKFRVL